jgi:molecular chaperone GrpE
MPKHKHKIHENKSENDQVEPEIQHLPEAKKDINSDEDRIEPGENEISNLKDRLLRALADTENMRKRAARETEEASKYAFANFARDLLMVSDNLRRAILSFEEGQDSSHNKLLEGVSMTEKELLSIFERFGIQKVSSLHEKFDSAFHQAMFEVDETDHPGGIIVEVLQDGYVLQERLLRPALVAVAKSNKALK